VFAVAFFLARPLRRKKTGPLDRHRSSTVRQVAGISQTNGSANSPLYRRKRKIDAVFLSPDMRTAALGKRMGS
jgi:hypothetical protein